MWWIEHITIIDKRVEGGFKVWALGRSVLTVLEDQDIGLIWEARETFTWNSEAQWKNQGCIIKSAPYSCHRESHTESHGTDQAIKELMEEEKTKEKKQLESPIVRRPVRKEKHWEGAMTSGQMRECFKVTECSCTVYVCLSAERRTEAPLLRYMM